jgi:hypothetical protein
LAEEAGITIVKGAKDQESNGSVWLNANITRDSNPPVIIKLANGSVKIMATETHNLKAVLMSAKQNLTGVIAMEISLKRTPDFTEKNRTYLLSPSLKMRQVIDITEISSPPLTKAVEFRQKNIATSERLIGLLQGRQPQTVT